VKHEAKPNPGDNVDHLSVSSNGSTWVKLNIIKKKVKPYDTFSILERIDVGETWSSRLQLSLGFSTFSILERIDVGETKLDYQADRLHFSFSILERIDVGETEKEADAVVQAEEAFSILERIDVGETANMA